MPRVISHEQLCAFTERLFEAAGANSEEAVVIANNLVTSSLFGHDSHGAMRIPEYLGFIEDGSIVPGAKIQIEKKSATTAIVDCGQGFGPVGATKAMETAIEMAREQKTASVITRRCNHVARLGAFVQLAADEGMIGIATCNSPMYGDWVVPFGGSEGRLSTNPIAYGVPTEGDPIIADVSTSMAPEGKIRTYMNQGKMVPDGWVQKSDGTPTNNPAEFYGPPKGGILPLGGSAGHKGYALSMLVEILGAAYAGLSSTATDLFGNGVCFLVLDPATFCPLKTFKQMTQGMVTYLKSSPPAPGFKEVLVPGELEFRTRRQREVDGISVDDPTWDRMCDFAKQWNVEIP